MFLCRQTLQVSGGPWYTRQITSRLLGPVVYFIYIDINGRHYSILSRRQLTSAPAPHPLILRCSIPSSLAPPGHLKTLSVRGDIPTKPLKSTPTHGGGVDVRNMNGALVPLGKVKVKFTFCGLPCTYCAKRRIWCVYVSVFRGCRVGMRGC